MKILSFVKEHPILCIIIFNLILVGITIGIIVNQATKTATIDILVAPADAKITLNGTAFKNSTSTDLHPGKYEVKLEKEGLETKTETLEIADGSFVRLHDYLAGENDSFDYYKTHEEDFYILKQVAKEDDEKAQTFIKIMSIKDILPYNYDAYSNNYTEYTNYSITLEEREDCPKFYCLLITDRTGNSRQLAMNNLKEYNIDNYEITYKYIPYGSVKATNE